MTIIVNENKLSYLLTLNSPAGGDTAEATNRRMNAICRHLGYRDTHMRTPLTDPNLSTAVRQIVASRGHLSLGCESAGHPRAERWADDKASRVTSRQGRLVIFLFIY